MFREGLSPASETLAGNSQKPLEKENIPIVPIQNKSEVRKHPETQDVVKEIRYTVTVRTLLYFK